MQEFQETIALALNYARMVWRYRWVVLVTAVVISFGGWGYVMLMPDRYQVSTKVYLDTNTLLRPLLKGIALDSGVRESAARLISRTLLVRPNLETVARKTDMDLEAKTPREFEALLTRLAEQIKVTETARTNIFVISYEGPDAKLATRVVEALLNIFVERSLGVSRKDTTQTKQFLDEQIKEYESRLINAEARLKEFKRKNLGLMPTHGGEYFARMEKTAAERKSALLELKEAEFARDELTRQLASVDAVLSRGDAEQVVAVAPHPLDARIGSLEARLDQLLMQYTELHPDVKATRSSLQDLYARKTADLRAGAGAEGGETGKRAQMANPIYQELKVALGTAEAKVASLQARAKEYRRRETELKGLIDTTLAVEAELARLNRDYGIDKKNYDSLVARREALKISDDASQTTENVRFNIIEPPREPIAPVGPNRPLLSAGVSAIALGGGLGIAFLIALLRPAIYTREALMEFTNLPLLGAVTRIWTPRERFKRKLEVVSFGFGCMLYLGTFAGLIVLELQHVDLLARIIQLGRLVL